MRAEEYQSARDHIINQGSNLSQNIWHWYKSAISVNDQSLERVYNQFIADEQFDYKKLKENLTSSGINGQEPFSLSSAELIKSFPLTMPRLIIQDRLC